MPVDLRQISFYPQQRQYIFSDSEPGIEVVQSGSGDYIKCTDENNAVVFRIRNDGLITSAAGQAEYSTLSSADGSPITLVAQGANQDVRFMHTANATGNVMGFFDGTSKHFSIGGVHDSTPDSRLHVIGATAGSVTAVTDTIITAENDDNAFISLLAPTSSGILFGDVADADVGRITYTHSSNALGLYVSASQQFTYTDAQLQFNKATSLTTSAGALTLAPVSGAHLNLTMGGAGDLRVNTSQLYVDTSAARVGVNTATPSASLEIVAAESATVPALMVQNSFDAVSNQVAVFKGANRGTAADNDSSYISYMMEDSAGNMVEVGRQIWQINDVTSNTKDSKFTWQVMVNNTLTDMLEISSSAAAVPTATFASGDAIFNDNVSIRLGTAGVEADLSSNGTDVKWEYAATADLLIGRASSPAPNGLLHLWEATAGSVDSITDSLLTLENDDNAYISILAPTVGGIVFGDAADNNVGSITYTHGTNTLNTTINAASQLNHTDGAFAFAKATTISTSSGTLTINAFTAGGAIDFGNQNMTNVDIDSGTVDGITLGTNSAVTQAVIDDIDLNGKVITMTGSASDTAVFTAGTNGTLSIVTTDAAAAAANIQVTADGTVDIDSAGLLTLDSGAAIHLEPASGSVILLDGTISVDAGVVTGATSITSTAFVGNVTGTVDGVVGGNTPAAITGTAIIGTTIDASTDFTVGNTVVTSNAITVTPSTSDTVTLTSSTNGAFSLVTVDDNAAAANIQITADGTVDIDSAGVMTLDSGAAINLEPAGGSAILLDGTISIDAGVVTGATSVTSTAFLGTLDGVIGGNTPAAITGTTIDATTDFTIGSLVITDDQIQMTPSASDTVTIAAAANGVLNLTTVDAAAAAAHFTATIDGNITLDAKEDVILSAEGGNVIMDDGTSTIFDFNVENTTLTIHDDQDTGDTVVMTVAQHGAFSIVSTDDDAAAANITITADGTFEADGTTITLDSSGDVVLDAAGGDVFFKAGGTTFGSATNTSGNLIIKSGTTTAATFTGANVVLAGTVGSGAITSTGLITGVGVTSTGDFTTTGAAVDWDLIDDNANALSFDSAGKAGILNIDTQDGSERVTMSGNLLVSGDFEVAGSNTTVSTTVIVADPLVALATTNTGNAVDIGFFGRYRTNGTNLYTGFVWNADASKYILFHANQAAPTTTVNTSGTGYTASTLVLGTLETTNVTATNINAFTLAGKLTAGSTEIEGSNFDIDGGAIDGVTLGTNSAITNAVIDDVAINGKVITMTGSASDTVTMTAATNGAFSLVTVDDAAAAANIQITADGTVDIDSTGVLTLDSGAAINIEPANGSAILLDGTISVDAGVVTGATSITSTNFVGTVTTATQNSITTMTGLVTTSTLNSGAISSGFGNIDIGSSNLTATGTISLGATSFNDNDITNVGGIALDTITSDAGAGITVTPTTDTFFSNGTGVVIGHTAQITSNNGLDELQVLGTGGNDSAIAIGRWSANAYAPSLEFVKSRHASIGSNTVVVDNDRIAEVKFLVDDGSDFTTLAAMMRVEVDDASPASDDTGAAYVWFQAGGGGVALRETMRLDAIGRVFIGDDTIGTSVDMDTAGLVINQAAGDKHILALKSSDVGHGMTTHAETDTYGFFKKSETMGGLRIGGLKASGGTHSGLALSGTIDGTQNTTKGTGGNGTITLDSAIRDGNGTTAVGSNGNLLTVANNGTTRFIFDAEGDFYTDASINSDYYDDYNDPVLVRDLDLAITQRFDQWTQYNRADIEKAKLAHFDEDGKAFVNWTKVWKLHNGAIWQLNEKIEELREENKALKVSLSRMLEG